LDQGFLSILYTLPT